jgi:putative endonuclease
VPDPRHVLGRLGEQLALEHLERLGYALVVRNHRTRFGELDLVVHDGRALVFVEVKARRAGSAAGPETPAGAVGHRKRAKLRSLAAAWLRERGYDVPRHRDLRFDVVGLRLDAAGRVTEYEHIRAAF